MIQIAPCSVSDWRFKKQPIDSPRLFPPIWHTPQAVIPPGSWLEAHRTVRGLVTTLLYDLSIKKRDKNKCLLLQTREPETPSSLACVPFCSPWPTIYLLRQDGLELHNSLQRWIMMLSHLPQEPGNTLSLKPGKCLVCFMCSGKNKAWQCCHLSLDSLWVGYCLAVVTCRGRDCWHFWTSLRVDKDI